MESNRELTLNIGTDTILKLLFFLYMCGVTAFNSGTGFDAIYCRVIFVVYIVIGVCVSANYGFLVDISRESVFRYYIIFVIYDLISAIWAQNLDDALNVQYINGFIQILGTTLILCEAIKDREEVISYLKLVMWAIVVMGLRLVYLTPSSLWGTKRVGEALSLNSNTVGTWCAIGAVLSFFYVNKKKLYIVVSLFLSIIVLFSGSRASFLMLLIGFVVYYSLENRGWKMMVSILIVVAIAVALLYLVINNEMLYTVLGYRLEKALANVGLISSSGIGVDGSANERSLFRKYAMRMFFTKPLLGWGSNGFVTYMRNIGYSNVTYSHCNYTEILANLGIVGFILFYAFRIKSFINIIIGFINTHENYFLIGAVMLIVFFVQDYLGITFYDPVPQIVFSLITMMAYLNSKSERSEVVTLYGEQNY